MRFSTTVPFLLAACLSSSCISPMVEPSLLAAEPYQPEVWNGRLSNEKLADIFNRHKSEIQAIAANEFKGNDKIVFPRKSHSPYEKTLWLIDRAKAFKAFSYTPQALSQHLGVSEEVITTMMPELLQAGTMKRFQANSNCYAYSVNFADKGSKDGSPGDRTLKSPFDWEALAYTKDFKFYVKKVIEGAISDGLIYTGAEAPSKPGFYRIAFYARPMSPHIKEATKKYQNNEYHFARQNRDGTWSHKYGSYNVMNIDYAGKLITDARTADMGDYRFIGYFMAPEGGIQVGYRTRFVFPPIHKIPALPPQLEPEEIVIMAQRSSVPNPAR